MLNTSFFQEYDEIIKSTDSVPKIREMILQLAVQGRLVEQDPKDESASVLLEKIKTEKAKLIKEGKIKKSKPLPEIKAEEVPYELPDGWEWARLIDLFDVRDGTHDTPKYVKEGYPLITSKNLSSGRFDSTNVKYISKKDFDEINNRSKVDVNDILFAMIGSIGNPVIVDTTEKFAIKNVALFKYYSMKYSNPQYLLYFLKYASNEMRINAKGALQPFVSLKILRTFPIPFPPLAEQHRIVARIETLMAICDQLEAQQKAEKEKNLELNKSSLHYLLESKSQEEFNEQWNLIQDNFDNLYDKLENVDKLQEAVLQLAVQGRLVEQDPNDEPASVLLEKVKVEKAKLIKEGKIKKSKPLPEIKAEEVPYGLPEGWEWARQIDIADLINGRAYKREEMLDAGTPLLRVGNLFTNRKWYYTDMNLNPEKYCHKGDLLYAWSASFGPFIWGGSKAVFHYHIWKVNLSKHIYKKYLYYFLLEDTRRIKSAGHGLSMDHITKGKMEKRFIPIPPLSEQHRIVARVEGLMALTNQLKGQIEEAGELRKELVESSVGEVLGG